MSLSGTLPPIFFGCDVQTVLGGHTEGQPAELCVHSQGHLAATADWRHQPVCHVHVPALREEAPGLRFIKHRFQDCSNLQQIVNAFKEDFRQEKFQVESTSAL